MITSTLIAQGGLVVAAVSLAVAFYTAWRTTANKINNSRTSGSVR